MSTSIPLTPILSTSTGKPKALPQFSPGPVFTLPGDVRELQDKENQPCERCSAKPATHRLQGETDSFGCEYSYFCTDCLAKAKAQIAVEPMTCEQCQTVSTEVMALRDPEEGLTGPVIHLCPTCNNRMLSACHDIE